MVLVCLIMFLHWVLGLLSAELRTLTLFLAVKVGL